MYIIVKKILFVLIGCTIVMFGCTQETKVEEKGQFEDKQVENDEKKLESDKETQIEEEENSYKIDKIVVPIAMDLQQGEFGAYYDFSYALIKEMAKEFNIVVEEIEFASWEDEDIALRRGM